jgi:acetamidase/formamidase
VLNRAPEDEPATTAKPEPVRPQRWDKQRVSNPAVAEVCRQLAECTKTEYRQTLVNTIETISRHYRIKDWASMALFLSLHTDNRCSPTGDKFNQSNLMRILDDCLYDGYITSQQLDSWVTRPRMTKKNRQRAGA